ncbi:LytTR family transcriptional regulator [Balneolaceae bacterium YR4-1]|uniref:LytTR family transcriptional regulator n=1 Tax=Halalkalibaculum roseum TaxID=2709311 RepID=A0A6M1SR37_9BACT|nr:LytTR family DNA-binding domain-containing protein [Halalkalibaculum roseum]NGP75280.1 LytTR family transcriptional regulator [Halalkalibaculum roseum]
MVNLSSRQLKNPGTYLLKYKLEYLLTLSTGFFLFVVLYLYEGFNIQQGLSLSGHSLLFRALSFGALTSLSFYINEMYTKKMFRPDSVLQLIAWHSWEIFKGACLTFLLFNFFWNWTEFTWASFSLLLGEYTIVMIFPIAVSYLAAGQAKRATFSESMLVFESENKKDRLAVHPENFLYITSEDNYIDIYYLLSGKVEHQLQRNTLKNIQSAFRENPYLKKCHRSYLVNPQNIRQIHHSGKSMKLNLGHQIEIPVSGKYFSEFSTLLD